MKHLHTKHSQVRILTTIACIITSLACTGQGNMSMLLDSVMQRAKHVSLYSPTVDWDSLQWEIYRQAEHAESIQDLVPAFTTLINGLKDKHGRILKADDYSTLAAFTEYDKLHHPDERPRDPAVREIVYDRSKGFEATMIEQGVGYIRIPGYPPDVDIPGVAMQIRKALSDLYKAGVEKWILDLRNNGGGNMHPMVAGIGPLIGEGVVGHLVDLQGNPLFDWEINEGNFIYAGYQALNLPNEPKFEAVPPVAVLLTRWTVSSGEVVATCFKGRPRTMFFGEMSGSLTTNTGWEVIDNAVILNISTAVFADRNHVSYPYNIPVDVEIPFAVPDLPDHDQCLQTAIKWLRTQR